MRLIKTYDGITLNCDVIAMIQPVFMNSASGVISESSMMISIRIPLNLRLPHSQRLAMKWFLQFMQPKKNVTMPDTSWKTGLFTMLAAITP